MKISRYAPEQVAFSLRQAERACRRRRFAARWASASGPSTDGRRGSKEWMWPRCGGSDLALRRAERRL